MSDDVPAGQNLFLAFWTFLSSLSTGSENLCSPCSQAFGLLLCRFVQNAPGKGNKHTSQEATRPGTPEQHQLARRSDTKTRALLFRLKSDMRPLASSHAFETLGLFSGLIGRSALTSTRLPASRGIEMVVPTSTCLNEEPIDEGRVANTLCQTTHLRRVCREIESPSHDDRDSPTMNPPDWKVW